LALGLALSFGGIGRLAAAPDPSLEQQLRAWLSGLTGVAVPELPLRITPEGDHYRAALPIGSGDKAGSISATLRPLDGGRWAVEDFALPPTSHFTMRVPAPDDPTRTVPAEATLNLAGQDGRMLVDPSLAGPSSFEARLRGVTLDVAGGGQEQHQQMDRYETHGTATPAAGGRLDFVQDATLEGWRIAAQPASGEPFALQARTLRANARLDGLNLDRLAPVVRAVLALTAAQEGDEAATRAALHRLVEALRDSVRSGRIEESFDHLQIAMAGQEATIGTLRLAFAADAPDSRLAGSIGLEMAGLEIPSLPPGFTPWVPRRIVLHPVLSGVGVAELTRLALAATATPPDDQARDAALAALFNGPGVTIGVDPLTIELPAARLDASGSVVVRGPDRYAGHAKVVLTGFDALMAQAQDDPNLRDAAPVLILARGLAKPEGDHLVWDVVASESGATVNGVDISSLAGGGQAPAQPPSKRQSHPSQSQPVPRR
jgi:hypothetical protein